MEEQKQFHQFADMSVAMHVEPSTEQLTQMTAIVPTAIQANKAGTVLTLSSGDHAKFTALVNGGKGTAVWVATDVTRANGFYVVMPKTSGNQIVLYGDNWSDFGAPTPRSTKIYILDMSSAMMCDITSFTDESIKMEQKDVTTNCDSVPNVYGVPAGGTLSFDIYYTDKSILVKLNEAFKSQSKVFVQYKAGNSSYLRSVAARVASVSKTGQVKDYIKGKIDFNAISLPIDLNLGS